MIELPPDFSEFLKSLNDHNVEYLLVGGFAVGIHGYPRSTGDLDIWIGRSRENARRIVAAIQEFGFDTPNLSADLFLQERRIVRMGTPPICIEVMTELDGVSFLTCRANRITADLDGILVPVIGLSDLKANKQASARHKDLDDLEHLP